MIVLGITGGTGCGKTTALQAVEQLGGCVIDCDRLYHHLLETDSRMLAAISTRFPGVITEGRLDRKALGQWVFADRQALEDLNAITHPRVKAAVRTSLQKQELAGCPLLAIDAIGLSEGGLAELCRWTIAITAPREARIERLMRREGISREYAVLRIDAQRTDAEFADACDYVLHNDCQTAEAFSQVCLALLKQILGGNTNV